MRKYICFIYVVCFAVLFSAQAYGSTHKSLNIIGLMSGTSMDGVDVALLTTNGVTVDHKGPSETYPYDPTFRAELRSLIQQGENAPKSLRDQVEKTLTDAHIDAVKKFMKTHNIRDVDLIGFHGHTVLHRPEKGYTLQIGLGQRMADSLGVPVMYDFRSNDVKHGGQGAPLAPVYHASLAHNQKQPLVMVNIGGVCNVTYIEKDTIIACDVGPGNALIDDWAFKKAGLSMDKDGTLASRGQVNPEKLNRMLSDPYFNRIPPKSLDRNHFEAALKEVEGLSLEDGAATLTAFTTKSLVNSLAFFPNPPKLLVLSGGGRHNKNLVHRIREELKGISVIMVDEIGYDGDALEAQLFAYLAARALYKLPLSFPGTTGVTQKLTGGKLARPTSSF